MLTFDKTKIINWVMARVRKRHTQVAMKFRTWGGKRRGAGRPAKGSRSSEPHRKRQAFGGVTPVHVTLRVTEVLAKLRRRDAYHAIRKAMQVVLGREAFRIVHISIEHGHLHLIVEAETSGALAKGMQGFQISAAKRLNATLEKRGEKRRGQVFTDRYHAVFIGSPTQARNSISYVLSNWRRHGLDADRDTRLWHVDYYSSGPTFRGWKELQHSSPFSLPSTYQPLPTSDPRTWLLETGWRRAGELSLYETPGGRRATG